MALGVIEQDLGLRPLGESGVRAALRELQFEWAFACTARIDAELRHGQLRERGAQAQLESVADWFHGHPQQPQLVSLIAREGRQCLNTPYLHAIQRLLVLEAADGVDEGPEDLRRLQDALLGICNVVAPASARPKGYDRDYFVALMTRSGVVNSTEAMPEAITRAYTIYHESPRRPGASSVPNYVPPARWEPDTAHAVSVHERFMMGMAVMGHVGVWGEELPPRAQPTGVPPDYFDALANELKRGDSRRLSRAIAGDRAVLRRMFEREQVDAPSNALNSIPFQVRPLLAQSGGGFLLSSTNALSSWMTRGVHYACLTPIEGTPAAAQFLTYVGRLFEAYAVELLQQAHRAQPEVRVFGEQPYDRGSSATSDIAVVDGSDLVLIEVEAHRFTKDALLGGDAKQVLTELETMVVSKARQIDDCITALRRPSSRATLPDLNLSDIERIWPVVVVEGGIVQTALLWDFLEDQLGDALQQSGVQRLSLMAMDDLEDAAGFVEHGHHLAMLLNRWKFGRFKHTDFAYYCSSTPGLRRRRRTKLVERRWRRLMDEVSDYFSEDARARLRDGT